MTSQVIAEPLTAIEENRRYKTVLKAAGEKLQKSGEIQKYDPEWLVRRGNYYTIITPEIAADLLERNRNNRNPKRRAIADYARDMRAGEWNADASDIKIDRQGNLLDGQNRLMACVESGFPFPTLLRTGLDPEAKSHVDQGVKRTAGDTLRMAGVVDPNHKAAAVNIRERYSKTIALGGKQAMTYARGLRVTMTHAELLDYFDGHPSIEKMGKLAQAMHNVGPGVPKAVYVAALSLFAESSEKMTRDFAEAFIEGRSSGTGDPILALMRYLAKAKSPTELRQKSANRNLQHLGAFVKAWNAWVQSEKLDRIVIRDSDLLEQPV